MDETVDETYATVREWLRERGIQHVEAGVPDVLVVGLEAHYGSMPGLVVASGENSLVGIWLFAGPRMPRESWPRVCEFLARVNDGLWRASLVLDFEEGMVHSQASLVVDDGGPSVGQLDSMLEASLDVMAQAGPGLLAVAFGDKDPEAAHAECWPQEGEEEG